MKEIVKFACAGIAVCASALMTSASLKLAEGENPLVPMIAMNGKPTEAFLSDILAKYKSAGFTQFLIYPREGCEIEYMSADWLKTCEFMLSEAERKGFTSVWLYDEFNYPSGTANKQVMKVSPDFELEALVVNKRDGEYVFEVRKNPGMANLLNPAAVECFISLTHDKYRESLGKHFGKIVRGFFTDEPCIAYVEPKYAGKDIVFIPYYPELERDYAKLSGGDLRADILRGLMTNSSPWEEPVAKLLARRFAETYFDRLTDWTRREGLFATGHLNNEHIASRALRDSGHPLVVLPRLSFPAVDEIRTQNDVRDIEWLTFGTEMYAAEKRGNKGGLAELFACGPCDMTFAQIRRQIWLSALFGVNRYVLAISPLDQRIRISKDLHIAGLYASYLSSFTPSQPNFRFYKELGEDSKLAAAFAVKDRKYDVAVRYPYKNSNLQEVLKALNAEQISWRLALPEETPAARYVLDITGGEFLDVKSRRKFADAYSFASAVRKTDGLPAAVLTPDGDIPRDIFVREYSDGSTVILNFSRKAKKLELIRKDSRVPFLVEADGVRVLPADFSGDAPATVLGNVKAAWKVSVDRPNTMRADFDRDGVFKFAVREPMKVIFAIRTYFARPELELDGKKLEAKAETRVLPEGYRNLYADTDAVELGAGEHVLKVVNGLSDMAYMPLVFAAGDFSYGNGELSKYRGDGEGLDQFTGEISQSAKVKIPVDARRIEAETDGLAAELFIDGKSLGNRLWKPFVWDIPEGLGGRDAEIKLTRATSLARIFGSRAFLFDENGKPRRDGLYSRRPANDVSIVPVCPLKFLK